MNNTAKQLVEQLGNSTEITIMSDIVHGLNFEYEQLQQENEELKKQYSKIEEKYFNNVPCCNENDCDLYKEYLNDKNILTKFEKWLKEMLRGYNDFSTGRAYEDVLDKLQELKEGNNEKSKNRII